MTDTNVIHLRADDGPASDLPHLSPDWLPHFAAPVDPTDAEIAPIAALLPDLSPLALRRTLALCVRAVAEQESPAAAADIVTRAAAAPVRYGRARAVVRAIADAYGLTWAEITGSSQRRRIAHPRQHAFWALRELCPHLSLPQIGMMFGKDHTTVLYGIRKHEARRAAS